MHTTFDYLPPLKNKLLGQKRLASLFNSQLRALKQTTLKLERKWLSTNLEGSQLVWKDSLILDFILESTYKARTAYYSSLTVLGLFSHAFL